MSVPLFRDYHKEVKDLLSKYHTKGDCFSVDSKIKTPKNQLILNPAASNEKGVSCTAEFKATQKPVAVKAVINSRGGLSTISLITEQAPHKVEIATDPTGAKAEIAYELRQGRFNLTSKLARKAGDVYISADAFKGLVLGAGCKYGYEKKTTDFVTGGRFTYNKYVFDFLTNPNFKGFTAGIMGPLKFHKFNGSVGMELAFANAKKYTVKGGFEAKCLLFPKNNLKVVADSDKKATITYLARLPDWTVAVSVNQDRKFGASFILE